MASAAARQAAWMAEGRVGGKGGRVANRVERVAGLHSFSYFLSSSNVLSLEAATFGPLRLQ